MFGLRPPFVHFVATSLIPHCVGPSARSTMSTKPSQFDPFGIGTPAATIPVGMRILAIVLRALFIGALVVVTLRVSSPQSESFASVYEAPGDLIRLTLGLAVCL
jgi:hypothetical protein